MTRQMVKLLREHGPTPYSELPRLPEVPEWQAGVARFRVHTSVSAPSIGGPVDPVAYLYEEHSEASVIRAFVEANPSLVECSPGYRLHSLFSDSGEAWKRASRTVLRDEMGLSIASNASGNQSHTPSSTDDEGLTHYESLKLAMERNQES